MKVVLFCENAYAFSVMAPIRAELIDRNYDFVWYIADKLLASFPYTNDSFTNVINELKEFKPSAIFVPGNEVPHYLPGVKVQIFHGLAGEKKGHFRIRHYFDLYLTQGPFFTKRFEALKRKHNDFEVVETGWSKLDVYHNEHEINKAKLKKDALQKKHRVKHILLYAPTFSPSLTSSKVLQSEIEELARNKDLLILIKFHDLMGSETIASYKSLAANNDNIEYITNPNILPYLLVSDLMISDTSSVVYEFLLLNKPVITLKARSPKDVWVNILSPSELVNTVDDQLKNDPHASKRAEIIADYHPYTDGMSSGRMIDATKNYIQENGIPEKRKLSFFRKWKINKMYRK